MSVDLDTIALAILGDTPARIEIAKCRGHIVASRVGLDGETETLFGHGSTPARALVDLLAYVEGSKREIRADEGLETALLASLDEMAARRSAAKVIEIDEARARRSAGASDPPVSEVPDVTRGDEARR